MKKALTILSLFALLAIQFACSSSDSPDTPVVDPPVVTDDFIQSC